MKKKFAIAAAAGVVLSLIPASDAFAGTSVSCNKPDDGTCQTAALPPDPNIYVRVDAASLWNTGSCSYTVYKTNGQRMAGGTVADGDFWEWNWYNQSGWWYVRISGNADQCFAQVNNY